MNGTLKLAIIFDGLLVDGQFGGAERPPRGLAFHLAGPSMVWTVAHGRVFMTPAGRLPADEFASPYAASSDEADSVEQGFEPAKALLVLQLVR